jgi:hypothetical protein
MLLYHDVEAWKDSESNLINLSKTKEKQETLFTKRYLLKLKTLNKIIYKANKITVIILIKSWGWRWFWYDW